MSLIDTVQQGAQKIKEAVGKYTRPKSTKGQKITRDRLYNYSSPEDREKTALYLVNFAQSQRSIQAERWERDERYYLGDHDAQLEYDAWCKSQDIPWLPATVPDPFIHCESQIVPDVPDFEFRGRDDDQDSQMALQRQYVVQYIADNNELVEKNTRAERRLVIYGDTEWKVGFDYARRVGTYQGDIFIRDLPTGQLIYDPVAVEMDECEYIAYIYPMHRMKAQRVFSKELRRLGIDSVDSMGGVMTPVELELDSEIADTQDDKVQVIEFWFRQPNDGSQKMTWERDGGEASDTVEWEAGDIACSILVGERELKYIPCYWRKTHRQNKMYPFVKYCRIPREGSIYGISEIGPIKELVDAADRELAAALLNDAMMANDMIIEEENALVEGEEIRNAPGAIIKVQTGRSNGIKRLGGLASQHVALNNQMMVLRDLVKQTAGNYDINMGDAPPANVNTLGGLVELRDQGNRRQSLKRADRMTGFKRLYKLADYTAIEFYDEDRVIFLGAKGKQTPAEPEDGTFLVEPPVPGMEPAAGISGMPGPSMDRSKGPVQFAYNSERLKRRNAKGEEYYPVVDCVIDVGEGVKNSRGMTISATENIAKMSVTPQNYRVVQELIKLLDLPNANELVKFYDQQFAPKPAMGPTAPGVPGGQPPMGGMTGGGPALPAELEQMLAKLPPDQQAVALKEFMTGAGGSLMGGASGGGAALPPELEQMLAQLPPEEQAAVLAEFLKGGGVPAAGGGM